MAIKNIPNTAHLFVQDTTTGLGKTLLAISGDFTSIKLNQDGVLSSDKITTISGSFVEDGAGFYSFNLALSDMNYKSILPIAIMANANYQAFGYVIYTENGSLEIIDSEVGIVSGFVDNLPTMENTLNTVSSNVSIVSGFVDDLPTMNTTLLSISGYVDDIPTLNSNIIIVSGFTDDVPLINSNVISISGMVKTESLNVLAISGYVDDLPTMNTTLLTISGYVDDIPNLNSNVLSISSFVDNIPLIQSQTDKMQFDGLNKIIAIATVSGSVAPTVQEIRQEIDSNSVKLLHIDTGIISITGSLNTNLDAKISSRSIAGDMMNLSGTATSAKLVDDIWDEILTGATHNIPSSSGRRLRQTASTVVWDGIAQGSGVNGNQIILDTGASSVNGSYDPSLIAIVGGTGVGQCRLILQYEGSTRTATVDRTWKVNPSTDSEFIIYAHPGREHVNEGLAQGGSNNTITLNASASSVNNEYNGQLVFIRSGLGEDQCRLVTAYNGTTKVATVDHNWGVNPNTTSAYVMLPNHIHETVTLDANQYDALAKETTLLSVSGDIDSLNDISVNDAKDAVWNAVMQYIDKTGTIKTAKAWVMLQALFSTIEQRLKEME